MSLELSDGVQEKENNKIIIKLSLKKKKVVRKVPTDSVLTEQRSGLEKCEACTVCVWWVNRCGKSPI